MSEDSSEKQPYEFSVYEKAGKVDSRKLAIAFGSVLRELRQERKLTQEKFAFECELDRTYISLLELGHRLPSLATMLALSSGLKITFKHLASLVEERLQELSNEYSNCWFAKKYRTRQFLKRKINLCFLQTIV